MEDSLSSFTLNREVDFESPGVCDQHVLSTGFLPVTQFFIMQTVCVRNYDLVNFVLHHWAVMMELSAQFAQRIVKTEGSWLYLVLLTLK